MAIRPIELHFLRQVWNRGFSSRLCFKSVFKFPCNFTLSCLSYLHIPSGCESLNPDIGNASTNYVPGTAYSHTSSDNEITVTCNPGYEWNLGKTVQNLECLADGWDLSSIEPCRLGEL